LYGYIAEGYWRDVGNLNEYQEAQLDVLRGLVKISVDGTKKGNSVIGANARIETDERNISGNNVIGKNTHIFPDVVLSNTVIGNDCEIFPGSILRNAVLWNGTQVGARSEIVSDVLGEKCIVGEDVILAENIFVGDQCVIGNKSKLFSNIKLWPNKTVEDGATLTRSLVWEDRWLRELFTEARVTGISNIDMNPEFGAKLGAAFGAFLGSGSTVVTSRDADNVSRMINRAVMTGLMSAGVHCSDLRTSSIPIVRHELRTGTEKGGIHVRKSPYSKNYTDIIFFDADGKDLPSHKTKSVERLFFGEDFARSPYDAVGTIAFPERTTESYIDRFIATINTQAIRSAGLKLVVDYSNGIASTIFPHILGNLNIQAVSLHAYLDSRKLTRTEAEIAESIRELSYVVTSLKYDIGCMLNPGAERLYVVDENGFAIDSDRLLTLVTKFVALANPQNKKIAVPITASGEVDMLAKELHLEVTKTRDSHLALMEAAADKEVKFVGGSKGGFIFNEFLFASDAMYSVAKLLECMAITKKRFGEIDSETPRLNCIRKNIPCSFNSKGRVMRRLMKDTESIPRDLIEGVRLYPDNSEKYTSILLNPDRTRPIFHIFAESRDAAAAEQLGERYEKKLLEWIKEE